MAMPVNKKNLISSRTTKTRDLLKKKEEEKKQQEQRQQRKLELKEKQMQRADSLLKKTTDADMRPSYQRGTGNNYYNPNMPTRKPEEINDRSAEKSDRKTGNIWNGMQKKKTGIDDLLGGKVKQTRENTEKQRQALKRRAPKIAGELKNGQYGSVTPEEKERRELWDSVHGAGAYDSVDRRSVNWDRMNAEIDRMQLEQKDQRPSYQQGTGNNYYNPNMPTRTPEEILNGPDRKEEPKGRTYTKAEDERGYPHSYDVQVRPYKDYVGSVQIGGQERPQTMYEMYENADPKLRGQIAARLNSADMYRDMLMSNPYLKYANIEDKAKWQNVQKDAELKAEEGYERQKNILDEEVQDNPTYDRMIEGINEGWMPDVISNPVRNEENDRALADFNYGQGYYDMMEGNPEREEKLKELWAPIEDGSLAAYRDMVNEYKTLETETEYAERMNRFSEQQLKNIEGLEGEKQAYNDLINQYDDDITMPEFVPEYDKGVTDKGYLYGDDDKVSDIHRIYSLINGGNELKSYVAAYGSKNGDYNVTPDYMYAMMLFDGTNGTVNEIEIFNNLYNNAIKEGREPTEARAFLEGMQIALRDRYSQARDINASELARNLPAVASGMSLLARQADTFIDIPRHIAHMFGDKSTEDVNSKWYSTTTFADQVEGTISKDIGEKYGEVWGKVYSGIMNSANNWLRAVGSIGGSELAQQIFTLTGFAAQVDQQAQKKYMSEGYGYDEAQKLAALDTASELAQEFIPIETMLGSAGKSLWRSIMDNTISELVQEGTGAFVFDPINGLITGADPRQVRADEIVAQQGYVGKDGEWVDLSYLTMLGAKGKKELMERADLQAQYEFNKQALEQAIGGAFGGMLAGTYGTVARVTQLSKTGKNIRNEQNTVEGVSGGEQLVTAAATLEGTESQQMAEEIQEKEKNGKKVTNYEIGQLAAKVAEETNEKIAEIAKETVENRITEQLKQKGVTGEQGRAIAEAMTNGLIKGKLTAKESKTIAGNVAAIGLWRSYNSVMSEDFMGVRQEVAKATEGVRSVAEKLGELTGHTARNMSEVSKEIDAAVKESETPEAALDYLAKKSRVISERFAEEAKKRAKDNEGAKNYVDDAARIYLAAMAQNVMPKVSIRSEDAEGLYNAAQAEFADNEKSRILKQEKVTPGKGTATYDGAEYGTEEWETKVNRGEGLHSRIKLQMNVLGEIAQKMGFRLNFVNRQGQEAFVHGWESADGSITVNIAGMRLSGLSKNMLATLWHELTHWLEQNSSEGYARLRSFILGQMRSQGVNVENRLLEIMDNQNSVLREVAKEQAKARGEEITEEKLQEIFDAQSLDVSGAMAELVAQSCEELLNTEAVRNELAKSEETVFGQVKAFVRRFIAQLNAALKGIDDSLSREAKALTQWKEEMAKLWLEARNEALGRAEEGAEAEGGTRYSTAAATALDREYMEAVKSGDMETAQKIVEQAAENAGYTMKVFHGTPTGGFTVFRDWSYFTENRNYANRYNHASASSIRGNYETTNPMTYELFMNPGKVFDTRQAKAKRLYNEARMEYGLGELNNTESGLPDWTDGRDIIEFIEDRGLDYDTIILDEGADGGYEDEVVSRGVSYVTRSNNVKSAETVTRDENGEIIPPSERFNTKNPDIRFSMAQPVEQRADGLIAVHNLGVNQFISSMEEGGLTAPSVAVIRANMGHSKYGEVSVVLYPGAIDPRRSVKNKVYGMDAWTPTRSNAQIETKLNYKVIQAARDRIEELTSEGIASRFNNDAMNWINRWLYEDKTTDTLDDMIDSAYRNDGMIIAYAQAHGMEIEEKFTFDKNHPDLRGDEIGQYNEFLDKLEEKGMLQEFMEDMNSMTGNEIIEKYKNVFRESGEYAKKIVDSYDENPDGLSKRIMFAKMKKARWYQEDGRKIKTHKIFDPDETALTIRDKMDKEEFRNWISELIGGALGKKGVYNGQDIFTSSGNRRSFEATHMEPTAENIVKAMYRNHEEKGGEAGGATGLMAKASKEYGSLAEIRKDSGRLQMMDESEYKDKVLFLDDQITNFASKAEKETGVDFYTIKELLIEAGGKYAKNQTAETIKRYFDREGVHLSQELLDKAHELIKEAQEIPTGYFEAKPQRVVGYDDIAMVIIPEEANEKIRNMMDERGISWETYDGTEEGRLEALNSVDGVRFSTAQPDREVKYFMLGLNENSMSTEQEKTMLRQFKELNTTADLMNHAIMKADEDIRKLQAKKELSAYDKREIDKLRIRKHNYQAKLEKTMGQLARATKDDGFAKRMMQQESRMRNLVSGRTYNEVRRTIEALTQQIAEADREIEARQKTINDMRSKLRYMKAATLVDQKAVEKLATTLRKEYNSSADKQEMIHMITEIRLKMAAGQNIREDVADLAWKIAAGTATDGGEQLRSLRGTTITLGAGQVKELLGKDSSMKELRSIFAGTGIKVKAAKDGETGLDKDWGQLCDAVPSLDRSAKELQQVDELIKFVQNQKSEADSTKMYEGHMEEFQEDLAAMIAAVGRQGTQDADTARTIRQMMDLIDKMGEGVEASRQEMQRAREKMSAVIEQGKLAMSQQDALQYDIDEAIKYNNALAQQSESVLWKAERKQLIEQLENKNTENLIAEQQKWKERIEKDKTARKMMNDNMLLRKGIHTNITRMKNLLMNETDVKNIPEHMKSLVREVLEMITENELGGRKITGIDRKDLMEMRRILGIMKEQDGEFSLDDLKMITDPEAQSIVEDALADIEDGIGFYNASSSGGIIVTLQGFHNALDRIAEAVATIKNIVDAERTISDGDWKILVADAAEDIAEGMKDSRFKGETRGRGSRQINMAKRAVVYGNMTPVYFFKNLRNKGMDQRWKALANAENRNGLEIQKASDFIAKIAEEAGYKDWAGQKVQVRLGGRDMEITIDQIMSLYAVWRREKTVNPEMSDHLQKGGVFFQEDDGTAGKLRKERTQQKPVKIDDAAVQELYSKLTDAQKTYLEKMVGYLSNEMSELGNEASMRMYGIKKYKEKWYFPMQVWDGVKSARSDRGISGTTENRAANKSWSKRRKNRASNALIIGDFTQVAVNHIVEMINYNTLAPEIENLNKVLNYQRTELNDDGDPYAGAVKRNMRVMFQEAYGKQALEYLETFMKDLNGGAVQDQRKTLREAALTMFKKNAVAGSMSVALQQPLSYIRAAMMISPKYLAAAINPAYWKGSLAEMSKYSGVAVIKQMGRFDMNFGQSAKDYVGPEKKGSIYEKVSDKLTVLPEKMDQMTWTRMWTAAKLETKAKNPGMDVKSDAFLQKVAERFNEVMRATQVYDSVLVKSSNMRSQNYAMKVITSFMAEPTLSINVLADATRSALAGEAGGKALLGKAVATFLLSAAAQAFFKGLMGSGRTPDEKKTWEENFLYKWWVAFMSEANPLGLIPGYSDLIEVAKNGELNDDAMGAIGKIFSTLQTAQKAVQGKGKGWYRDLEDTAAQLAQLFTNVPAKNLMRDARAMYNWISQEPYAKRESSGAVKAEQFTAAIFSADNLLGTINTWLGDAGYKTSNKAYYQRMYSAQQRGDTKTAEQIAEYLKLAKGQDEKAIKSGVGSYGRADLWTAMDANKAEDIGTAISLMKQAGYEPKDIKTSISSHYKQEYLNADANGKRKIRDAMQKAYKKLGFTAEDADKTIANWEKKKKDN